MLAEGRVRMLGEPVALVIASDRSTASDAVDRVVVDYEPTPVVIHAEDALEPGAPLLHDDAPGNLGCTLAHKTEGFDAVFDAAPVKIRQTIDNQRLTPVAIETRAVLADWSAAADELTLYSSTQIPHYLRTFVALICGIPECRCRVIAPDVGGGFGSKLNCYAEEFAVAQASKLVGAPVKWIEGRSEAMLATIHGRDQLQHVELAADRDGRVQALRIELIQNYGAYLQFITPSIAHLTVFMVPGAYDIQQVDITCRGAFTNTTPTDAYRGAGRPEATHMIERMMDLLADELGIDPAEIRRRNFIKEFPYTTATGLSYDSGNYAGALDKALAMADYAGFEGRRAEARARGKHRGIGLSTWVEICGLAPSAVTHAIGIGSGGWESSILRLHPTGTATVITGSSAHGQGHATTWSQIVESELGIPFADIDVLHGDTQYSPYGIGTFGSRSLAVGGTALQLSCVKVREKARLLAAHMLECAPDDLEWGNGKWSVKGSPERAKTIQELAGAAWLANSLPEGMEPNLEAATFFDPPNCTFPFGTHIAEVEIDPRDRQGHDRALHRGRRLRQRRQSRDRRGPGARRHRPVDRAGALRGDGLRRRRPDADRHARRLHDPERRGAAALRSRADGDAVADEPARRQGHRRGGHDRRVRRPSSTPPSTRSATSASSTSRCRCSPHVSGRRCRREVARDPRGVRLRAAGHASRRPWPARRRRRSRSPAGTA